MRYYAVVFQCFLCAVLLTSLIIIKAKSHDRTAQVCAVGKSVVYNETLYDFCSNLYGDLLYE